MSNPLINGEIAEAAVTLALLQKGKVVLHPHGNGQRYDLVIDDNGQFHRIQVKAGWLANDRTIIRFVACSNNKGYSRRSYQGQIEFFAVYCAESSNAMQRSCQMIENPFLQCDTTPEITQTKLDHSPC